jgi:hypothetical protein
MPGYQFHGLPWWLMKRIVPAIHFVTPRKQLFGIAEPAEWRPAAKIVETIGPSEGHKDAA